MSELTRQNPRVSGVRHRSPSLRLWCSENGLEIIMPRRFADFREEALVLAGVLLVSKSLKEASFLGAVFLIGQRPRAMLIRRRQDQD